MGRVGSWALCCKTFQQLSCLHGHVIHGKEWVTKSKLGCLCKRLLQEALEFLFIKNNYKDYITWNFVSKTTRIPQEGKSMCGAHFYTFLYKTKTTTQALDSKFAASCVVSCHFVRKCCEVTSSIDNFNLGIMLAILQTYKD